MHLLDVCVCVCVCRGGGGGGLAQVYYVLYVFDSIGFSFLSLKNPIIHALSKVMKKKRVDSYCFIISKCHNFHILFRSEYHQKSF